MEAAGYLVLFAFLVLGSVLIMQFFGFIHAGSEIVGKPAIVPFHYYGGKIALFSTWLFFISKVFYPELGLLDPSATLAWVSVFLLYLGVAIMVAGLIELGLSGRIGIPDQQTWLKTGGIYKYSRNPLYVSSVLIAIASCLFVPDLINVTFTIYGAFIHHLIVLQEEKFLHNKFGEKYETYCMKVRRYL